MSDGEQDAAGVIDADLRMQHADVSLVSAYMDEGWRHYLGLDEDMAAHSSFHFHLPNSSYYDLGGGAGDSPLEVVQQHLDRHDIRYAILNPGTAARISGLAYADACNELARSTNAWLAGEWLDRDDRFLGSMVVSPRDPVAAVAEIRRVGRDARVVQVSMAYPQELLGHRMYAPIYEAAAEHGLVLNLDAGGGFVGVNRGYMGSGHPASTYEFRVASALSAQTHLVNYIAEGWFDRIPELKLTITGSSVAWVPALFAAMDAQYQQGDVDAKLQQLPSEYLADFVRFTTSSADWEYTARIADMLSTIDASKVLLFASGTPFRPGVGPDGILARLPDGWRPHVAAANAAQLYPLPTRARSTAGV